MTNCHRQWRVKPLKHCFCLFYLCLILNSNTFSIWGYVDLCKRVLNSLLIDCNPIFNHDLFSIVQQLTMFKHIILFLIIYDDMWRRPSILVNAQNWPKFGWECQQFIVGVVLYFSVMGDETVFIPGICGVSFLIKLPIKQLLWWSDIRFRISCDMILSQNTLMTLFLLNITSRVTQGDIIDTC